MSAALQRDVIAYAHDPAQIASADMRAVVRSRAFRLHPVSQPGAEHGSNIGSGGIVLDQLTRTEMSFASG